jgi:hypothetical protein
MDGHVHHIAIVHTHAPAREKNYFYCIQFRMQPKSEKKCFIAGSSSKRQRVITDAARANSKIYLHALLNSVRKSEESFLCMNANEREKRSKWYFLNSIIFFREEFSPADRAWGASFYIKIRMFFIQWNYFFNAPKVQYGTMKSY